MSKFQNDTKTAVRKHLMHVNQSAIGLNDTMIKIAVHIFNDGNGDTSLANFVVQQALAVTGSGASKGNVNNVLDVAKIVAWFERFGFCKWKSDKDSPYGGGFVLRASLKKIRSEQTADDWKAMKAAKNRFFNLQKEAKAAELKDLDGYKRIESLLAKVDEVLEAGKECNLSADDVEILRAMVERHQNPVAEVPVTLIPATPKTRKTPKTSKTPKTPDMDAIAA